LKSLTEAARGSKGQSWWSQYRDVVSPPFAQYLGHEGSAKSIRIFHPFLIPGLLQTQEYAVELLRVHLGARQTKRVVELRMKRQDSLLSQVGHPDVAFILGEESLYRWIGGPAVMRRQLQSLLEINTRPGITVQIVPFIAGAHPGLIGSFVLLGLAGSAEEILFLEGANGDMVSRADQERILKFGEHFEVARGLALPDDQAVALIHRQIRRLNQEDDNGRQ
jgi:hypothetical protein